MATSVAEPREFVGMAVEALGRYKLRTALSVLGVVLGVAAVIAMMSVAEGASRQALAQIEALGLDNLVARSSGSSTHPGSWRGLTLDDVDRASALVPLVKWASPLVHRQVQASRGDKASMTSMLGVTASYREILRLSLARGRFVTALDAISGARVCVLGATLARELFGFRAALGERVVIDRQEYEVIGILRSHGVDRNAGSTLAWHDLNSSALVALPTVTGRSMEISPHQPIDEIWLQVEDGSRAEELGRIFTHTVTKPGSGRDVTVIVPRELLAQRHRTQRTFSVVVGSVAVLALLVGGIGIMNIMLTSVVERTREIGVRRTVGATRRDVGMQFLIETLLMTLSGGALGIVIGVLVSAGITAFAGWSTFVSPVSIALGFVVSLFVGLGFGLYPAIKAASLEPVDAMRYE